MHPWGVMGYYRARGRGLAVSSGLHRQIQSVMFLHQDDSNHGTERGKYCAKSRSKLCSGLEGIIKTIKFYVMVTGQTQEPPLICDLYPYQVVHCPKTSAMTFACWLPENTSSALHFKGLRYSESVICSSGRLLCALSN